MDASVARRTSLPLSRMIVSRSPPRKARTRATYWSRRAHGSAPQCCSPCFSQRALALSKWRGELPCGGGTLLCGPTAGGDIQLDVMPLSLGSERCCVPRFRQLGRLDGLSKQIPTSRKESLKLAWQHPYRGLHRDCVYGRLHAHRPRRKGMRFRRRPAPARHVTHIMIHLRHRCMRSPSRSPSG